MHYRTLLGAFALTVLWHCPVSLSFFSSPTLSNMTRTFSYLPIILFHNHFKDKGELACLFVFSFPFPKRGAEGLQREVGWHHWIWRLLANQSGAALWVLGMDFLFSFFLRAVCMCLCVCVHAHAHVCAYNFRAFPPAKDSRQRCY